MFFSEKINFKTISPGTLSFVGDAVFSIMVREKLAITTNFKAGELHKKSISFVSASAQTRAYEKISDSLDEKEKMIFKRGRNMNLNNIPKGCTIAEYRTATGLEALFGYLYLNKQIDRLCEIFECIYHNI